ncbi:type IV pilus modification PilV family protein [Sporosarcina sp. FA9]|uniref:type IV pilus modification PilV family protein n=1 Tax=Sporosarcina sp. FA9 TaxID=3413030 RepID=UPI003F6558C9
MRKRKMGEKGVTLVEILATLVLLSIVLIGFFSFFTQSATFTKHNKEKLTAVQIAEDVVAKIRNSEYPDTNLEIKDYSGYIVDIVIEDGPAGLKKAEIKVETDTTTGIKGSSFTTEMYFEE